MQRVMLFTTRFKNVNSVLYWNAGVPKIEYALLLPIAFNKSKCGGRKHERKTLRKESK